MTNYFDAVRSGADPIEAIHGHRCGPDCWHQQARDSLKRPFVTSKTAPKPKPASSELIALIRVGARFVRENLL